MKIADFKTLGNPKVSEVSEDSIKSENYERESHVKSELQTVYPTSPKPSTGKKKYRNGG